MGTNGYGWIQAYNATASGGVANLILQPIGGNSVGIGNTSPAYLFHVDSGSFGMPLSAYHSSPGIAGFDCAPGQTELVIGLLNQGSFPMWLQARSSAGLNPIALNPLGGSVGIGTDFPQTTLDVDGNVRIGQGNPGISEGDLSLARSDGTAFIFFGSSGSNYLTWNGSGFAFNPPLAASAEGLPAGTLWSDNGVIKVAQ
jgi:hypothetical protein